MHNLDPQKDFLFCTHCGRNVYPSRGTPKKFDPAQFALDGTLKRVPPKGVWVATNSKGKFSGYRVVRMMMPWAVWRSENGTGILDRLESWPERRFQNEVMGLAFDGGDQPFPESVIRKCCTSPVHLPRTVDEEIKVAQQHASYPCFMGLDWAMSVNEDTAAYTTCGVWCFINGKLRLLYAHRFVGLGSSDPEYVLTHIAERMERFSVSLLVCDYGVGYWEGRRLIDRFGHGRVAICHYTGSSQMAQSRYDVQAQKWIVPRTATLQNLEHFVKQGKMDLPPWEEVEPYVRDWLRVTIEISEAFEGGTGGRGANVSGPCATPESVLNPRSRAPQRKPRRVPLRDPRFPRPFSPPGSPRF